MAASLDTRVEARPVVAPPTRTEADWEDSTVRKIISCLPGVGFVVGMIAMNSIRRKLEHLPLPARARPLQEMVNTIMEPVMNESASVEAKRAAYDRAIQLHTIERSYKKTVLVNHLLMVAVSVGLLARKIVPTPVAVLFVGGFSLLAGVVAWGLRGEGPIQRYERYKSEL